MFKCADIYERSVFIKIFYTKDKSQQSKYPAMLHKVIIKMFYLLKDYDKLEVRVPGYSTICRVLLHFSYICVCILDTIHILWEILKEMGIPDHLTCLLRNLYAGQEATVRTEHGTTDWFKIGKRVLQGCILSPCLFNLYAKYIMQNARLDEA